MNISRSIYRILMTEAGPQLCKKQSSCREYPFCLNGSWWDGQNSSFYRNDGGSLFSTNGKQLHLFREGINTFSWRVHGLLVQEVLSFKAVILI